MSKPANKTVIGLFIVVALALVVAAVLVLGSGKFFKNNPKAVMFFQGSVKGLSVGSPVEFRGVKIGTVTDIKMLFNPKDLSIMIPVYVEFERGSLEAAAGGISTEALRKSMKPREFFQDLIGRGLRAQLETQSIVTGQLLVSLDFYKDKPVTLVGADRRYLEIPTVPTTLQQLAERLEKIPVEEIFNKLNAAMTGIDKLVNSPDTGKMVTSIRQAVDDTRSLVQNVDKRVEPVAAKLVEVATRIEKLAERLEPLASSITKTSEEAGVTLKKAQATMSTIEDWAGEDSIVSYRLGKAIEELGATARAVRFLADTIQHQPDAIIFGKKNTRGEVR